MVGQGQTPRKRERGHGRHQSASQRNHPHRQQRDGGGLGTASDYDSDAAQAQLLDQQSREAPPPPPNPALLNRTNTDLNLSVLRRYVPAIHSILSIAANAVVYTFAAATSSWERTGAEGTYFLCFLTPKDAGTATATGPPRACIFVLNRRGLENTVLDLGKVENFEVMDEIYIFKMAEGGQDGFGGGTPDHGVVGVWIHAEDQETRMANAVMIQETMRLVRSGHAYVEGEDPGEGQRSEAAWPDGRQISVGELLGAHNGIGG